MHPKSTKNTARVCVCMAWKVASAREYSRHSTQTYNIATDRATPSTKQVYEKKKKRGRRGRERKGGRCVAVVVSVVCCRGFTCKLYYLRINGAHVYNPKGKFHAACGVFLHEPPPLPPPPTVPIPASYITRITTTHHKSPSFVAHLGHVGNGRQDSSDTYRETAAATLY